MAEIEKLVAHLEILSLIEWPTKEFLQQFKLEWEYGMAEKPCWVLYKSEVCKFISKKGGRVGKKQIRILVRECNPEEEELTFTFKQPLVASIDAFFGDFYPSPKSKMEFSRSREHHNEKGDLFCRIHSLPKDISAELGDLPISQASRDQRKEYLLSSGLLNRLNVTYDEICEHAKLNVTTESEDDDAREYEVSSEEEEK